MPVSFFSTDTQETSFESTSHANCISPPAVSLAKKGDVVDVTGVEYTCAIEGIAADVNTTAGVDAGVDRTGGILVMTAGVNTAACDGISS
jgi:hypothetical protein